MPTYESSEAISVLPNEHVKHLATLIFLSYRYSQGAIGTQNRMLMFIEDRFHPDIMNGPDREMVITETRTRVEPYFLNDTLHPATAIPWDEKESDKFHKHKELVVNELAGLFERFRNRTILEPFSGDPIEMASSVITMDADYMKRRGGRAGSSSELKIRVSPYTRDPYRSLFIHHGILEESTNTVEYDAIFNIIASDSVIQQQDKPTLRQLKDVISIYSQHHPAAANNQVLVDTTLQVEELINGK